MESTLGKINNMADKAMLEMQKQPLVTWNPAALNTFRFILDRLKLCLDELNFNLLKKDLYTESSILQKLSNDYTTVFDKIIEINARKAVNAPEVPIEYCKRQPNTTRAVLGGTQVQDFKIYSQKQSEFIEAEQQFKPNKQKVFKKVESRGTCTSEDAAKLLFQGTVVSDTEKELLKMQEENELILMDLRKHLKLRNVWQEITSSHASHKLSDLNKHMEREVYKNDIYLSEQLKICNEGREDEEFDVKKEVKDKITLVQRKTAERIIKAAERKMKAEYDAFVVKKAAGILIKKSKTQNFGRIDELEKLIKDKNEEIVEKEAKINQLFHKFEEQERKFANLLRQIDNYKAAQKVEVCNTIVSHNGKKSDVEIQVSMIDPRVELFELRLQEIMDENEEMKEELKFLHERALEDKYQSETAPKQIEEVLLLLLQSDLSPENKIISLQTLLQYIRDNSAEDIARLAPNELYRIVRSRLKFNPESPLEKLDELSNDEDESYNQQSTKKRGRNKNKRMSQITKPQDPPITEFIDLDKVVTQRKQEITEEEMLKSKKQQIQLHQMEEMRKSNTPKALEQVNSPKSTNRANITLRQKPSYMKSNRNNSAKNNESESKKDDNSSVQQNPPSRPTLSHLESNKQSFTNFSQRELAISKNDNKIKKASLVDSSDLQSDFYRVNKTKDIGIQVQFKDEQHHKFEDTHHHQKVQQQIKKEEKEKVNSQEIEKTKESIKMNESQIYRPTKEVVSQKTTQTDDFFLWNLFQKMAGDLGLSEEQVKKLETVFLNEQQFIHFYEKTQSQKMISRASSMQMDTQGDYKRDSLRQLDKGFGPRNSIKVRTGSQQRFDSADGIANYIYQGEQNEEDQFKNQQTQPTSWHSPVVSRQQSQILFTGNQNRLNNPGDDNMFRSNSPMNPNSSQGLRSVSQLINAGDNVHVITYGTVTPTDQKYNNKLRTSASSQKILDDMLKQKVSLSKSPDQQREQKEQQLFFQIFGDDLQNDEEFDLEVVRHNFGKPLEIIQDHLKEESIKKVFTQLVQKQKNEWKDKLLFIISTYCNKSVQAITYFDFKKYYENYMRVHKRCGDECIHIKRFLARVGFGFTSKRKILNMSKSNVSPFEQFPKLK